MEQKTPVDVVWMREVPPDFWSKMIMWFMGKPYSHVAVIAKTDGRLYLCHAIGKGVCYEDPVAYLKTHQIVLRRRVLLNCSADRAIGYMMGENGKEYSDTQLLLIFFKLHWLTRLMNGDGKRICSEFVACVLKHFSNFKMPANLDLVTPKDLERILQPEQVQNYEWAE